MKLLLLLFLLFLHCECFHLSYLLKGLHHRLTPTLLFSLYVRIAAASAEEAAALAEEAVGAVFDDHDDNHGNFDADDEIALAAAAAGELI
jgi:hypothetical protein